MMKMAFTHLQVRSSYSLMDSTITIEKLINRAKELHFEAIALTDEHVLYGVIPFYKACMQNKIKPIIGMIVKVEADEQLYEMVLLAKSNKGYQNLVRLSSHIQLDQLNSISMNDLSNYTRELIGILPAHHEQLSQQLMQDTYDQVAKDLQNWQEKFDHGDFYLGLEARQTNLIPSLKAFQEVTKFPVVAISDVRYLDEKDDVAFDVLQAMKKGKQWGMSISSPDVKQRHLRSNMEMEQLFEQWPEVIAETKRITDKCHVTFDFGKKLLPSFPVPDNRSANDYLENLCWEKVKEKYETVTDTIANRLAYELHVIQSMDFSDYFLIVADFIQYAKGQKIAVGPGRGSSAGSIVAYILGITDVDPIKFNLLFERFLNPERKTMPDIDVDFSDERRDEVIEYVRDKYGREHVAQIITFGTFAARSIVRELMKTLDVEQQDVYFILKQLPQQSSKKLVDIIRESEELKTYIKASPKLKTLFSVAVKLEGIPRHISTHAAGVVISDEPLLNHVPLTTGTNETRLTQFSMNDLEALGLLKMDFLGLRNLSLLEKIVKSIYFTSKQSLSMENFPEHDEKTFALLRSGKTNGVFQLESQGMKNVLTQLKPDSFEDIVAVNALFRPGPMDFIPVYIARKDKREQVQYPHPDLESILKPTYGVLVYQEQIMQIAHKIAGFNLGQADLLRRAVSKKKPEVMQEQRAAFIEGCMKNGYSQSIAEEIFSWIVRFSNYGFPRSHAVAYSKISYQLSYLKTHYPANFFAELLNFSGNKQEKWNLYLKEIREGNIQILPPSINHSFGAYSVERGNIRFGLSAIKGVGNQVIKEILDVRKDRRFQSLFDFCLRVNLDVVSRTTIENLIMVGAFDELHSNRASLLASLDQALEQGELFKEFAGQASFFQDEFLVEYEEIEDFTIGKKLADEKELVGTYLSSHPLKEYRETLRGNGYLSLQDSSRFVGKRNQKAVVLIQSIRVIRTKRGESMAFLTLGDELAEVDAVVFPELYRKCNHFIQEEAMVEVIGKIDYRNEQIQWVLAEIQPFSDELLKNTANKKLFIRVRKEQETNALSSLQNIALHHPGNTPVLVYNESTKKMYQLTTDYNIHVQHNSLTALKNIFGKENVVLQSSKGD